MGPLHGGGDYQSGYWHSLILEAQGNAASSRSVPTASLSERMAGLL